VSQSAAARPQGGGERSRALRRWRQGGPTGYYYYAEAASVSQMRHLPAVAQVSGVPRLPEVCRVSEVCAAQKVPPVSQLPRQAEAQATKRERQEKVDQARRRQCERLRAKGHALAGTVSHRLQLSNNHCDRALYVDGRQARADGLRSQGHDLARSVPHHRHH